VKVWQRLLLGSGRLPAQLRASLVTDVEMAFLEEGLIGSVTRHNIREPGHRAAWDRQAVSGAIAVTGHGRVVVWAGWFKYIDVPVTNPLWSTIEFTSEPDRVCFAYHPVVTHPEQSRRVEVCLKTRQAPWLSEILTRPV
jgi:hypothetical protein